MHTPHSIEPHRSRSHRFQIQQSRTLGDLFKERFILKISQFTVSNVGKGRQWWLSAEGFNYKPGYKLYDML